MANNRMYLRCKVCGKTYYLAKNFGEAFYLSYDYQYPNAEEFCKGLDDFFERHFFCSPSDGGAFEIEKEWDANEDKWCEPMFTDEEWEQHKKL